MKKAFFNPVAYKKIDSLLKSLLSRSSTKKTVQIRIRANIENFLKVRLYKIKSHDTLTEHFKTLIWNSIESHWEIFYYKTSVLELIFLNDFCQAFLQIDRQSAIKALNSCTNLCQFLNVGRHLK